MTELERKAVSGRSRRGRTQSRDAAGSSRARASRGWRESAEQLLAELEPMVAALIKENRELHRQIDQLSKQNLGPAPARSERALRSLERRVRGSLGGSNTTGSRQSGRARSGPKARRKVTDPELLERRRQALAKAREARRAKRAGAKP
jgi:hypothetical protein